MTFSEPANIHSILEEKIFGKNLIRNGAVSSTLGTSGTLPASPITPGMIDEHLTDRERVMYQVATRNGDKNLLRDLNAKITKQMLSASTKAVKSANKAKNPTTVGSSKASTASAVVTLTSTNTKDDGSANTVPEIKVRAPRKTAPKAVIPTKVDSPDLESGLPQETNNEPVKAAVKVVRRRVRSPKPLIDEASVSSSSSDLISLPDLIIKLFLIQFLYLRLLLQSLIVKLFQFPSHFQNLRRQFLAMKL